MYTHKFYIDDFVYIPEIKSHGRVVGLCICNCELQYRVIYYSGIRQKTGYFSEVELVGDNL